MTTFELTLYCGYVTAAVVVTVLTSIQLCRSRDLALPLKVWAMIGVQTAMLIFSNVSILSLGKDCLGGTMGNDYSVCSRSQRDFLNIVYFTGFGFTRYLLAGVNPLIILCGAQCRDKLVKLVRRAVRTVNQSAQPSSA